MRNTLKVLLAGMMCMALASACSNPSAPAGTDSSTASFDPGSVKTLGDLFAVETDEVQWSMYENHFVYAFDKDGQCYLASVILPDDLVDDINGLNFMDENYEDLLKKLLGTVPVTDLEHLNETAISQNELNQLTGKTGADLLDRGWEIWVSNLDTMKYTFYDGPHAYEVVFDGKADSYDIDPEEFIRPLKIISVTFCGLGDASGN